MYPIGTVNNTVTVLTYAQTDKLIRTEVKLKDIGENTLLATYAGEAKVLECSEFDPEAEKQQVISIKTLCGRTVGLLAQASVLVRTVLRPAMLAAGQRDAEQLPADRAGLKFFSPPSFCRVAALRVGDYLHLDYDYAVACNLIPDGQPVSCLKSLRSNWRPGDALASRLWKSPWWADLVEPDSLVGDRIGYWLPITKVRLLSVRRRGIACTVDRLGLAIVSGIATRARYGKLEAVDGPGTRHK